MQLVNCGILLRNQNSDPNPVGINHVPAYQHSGRNGHVPSKNGAVSVNIEGCEFLNFTRKISGIFFQCFQKFVTEFLSLYNI